jgi:hypothetical protein
MFVITQKSVNKKDENINFLNNLNKQLLKSKNKKQSKDIRISLLKFNNFKKNFRLIVIYIYIYN